MNYYKEFLSKYKIILYIILCSILLALMIIRCFFGIEFTDEAYYVSNALSTMNGNTMYAYNSYVSSGEQIIPLLFYKIYSLFVTDLEGVFLYSRICYLIFRYVIICVVCNWFRKYCSIDSALKVMICLIPIMGSMVQNNFSYNSIPFYLTVLISSKLFFYRFELVQKYRYFFLYGIICALTIMAHPLFFFSLFIYIVFLYFGYRKNLKFVAYFCFGGLLTVLIVLVVVAAQTSVEALIQGIRIILFMGQKIPMPSLQQKTIEVMKLFCGDIIRLAVACLMGIIATILSSASHERKGKRKSLIIAICIFAELTLMFLLLKLVPGSKIRILAAVLCIVFLATCFKKDLPSLDRYYSVLLFSLAISVLFAFTENNIETLGRSVLIVALVLLLNRKARVYDKLILLLMMPYILFILLECILTNSTRRFYFIVPVLIGIIYCLDNISKNLKEFVWVCIIFISTSILFVDYNYVYRDSPISELNTRVEAGVYKGIYTTTQRATDVVEFEDYLNKNIGNDETVSFRDNVPVAYLMKNKKVCDIRTWDEMQYSYGCNDPTSMYSYYKNRNRIPDVICYVDFGRDADGLSIDNSDEEYIYNRFVKKYYNLEKDEKLNDTFFHIKIYRNNGTFNYDFARLIESVKN